MANVRQKKVLQTNAQILSKIRPIFLSVNLYFLLVRLIYQYSSLAVWNLLSYFITVGLSWIIYFQLIQLATPEMNGKEIINPGQDLSAKGLVSYMFDILYITWFIQITTSFSNWFWMVYLLIPIYASYLLFSNIILPFFNTRKMMSQMNANQQ